MKIMSETVNCQYQANNPFSKPVSSAQVTSWVIFLSQALVFYIYVINQYQSTNFQLTINILYTLSFMILIIATIWTGKSDPTDDLVIANKKKDLKKYSSYNCRIISYKQAYKKIYYCPMCESVVKQKSRHCRTCGWYLFIYFSCSQHFDHHCIWLNICIGHKNYRPFIITISMTFFNFFFYLLGISFLTEEIRVTQGDMKTAGFILMWIVGIVVIVFEFLITNLILLHIYLIYKGLSTYQFLMLRAQQKLKEEQELKEKNIEAERKEKTKRIQSLKLRKKQPVRNEENMSSINDQKLQNEEEQKSDQISESQSQNSIKKTKKQDQPKENNLTKKIDLDQCTQIKLERPLQDFNPNDVFENLSHQLSSNKKLEQLIEKNESINMNTRDNRTVFSKNSINKKNINSFFVRNASLDLIFSTLNKTYEPHQDLCKEIELDEQIKQYKKHQNNTSSIIQNSLKKINKKRPGQWGLLRSIKNKKYIVHDFDLDNNHGPNASFKQINSSHIKKESLISISEPNLIGIKQKPSLISVETKATQHK